MHQYRRHEATHMYACSMTCCRQTLIKVAIYARLSPRFAATFSIPPIMSLQTQVTICHVMRLIVSRLRRHTCGRSYLLRTHSSKVCKSTRNENSWSVTQNLPVATFIRSHISLFHCYSSRKSTLKYGRARDMHQYRRHEAIYMYACSVTC